jgi:hypothetical protein
MNDQPHTPTLEELEELFEALEPGQLHSLKDDQVMTQYYQDAASAALAKKHAKDAQKKS